MRPSDLRSSGSAPSRCRYASLRSDSRSSPGVPSIEYRARRAAKPRRQRQQQLPLPLSVETAEAHHLTGVELERESRRRPRPGSARNLDDGRRPTRRAYRAASGTRRQLASDHELDNFAVRLRSSRVRSPRCGRRGYCASSASSTISCVRCVDETSATPSTAQPLQYAVDRHVGGGSGGHSPHQGSGCRGFRASAFTISTICRHNSSRSFTGAEDDVHAGAQRFLREAAFCSPVDEPEAAQQVARWRSSASDRSG